MEHVRDSSIVIDGLGIVTEELFQGLENLEITDG